MQKTIKKIHKKFDTAGEKLLAEAKELVKNPKVDEFIHAERFAKIGFTVAKPVKSAEEIVKKQMAAKETIEAIEYYRLYYPNYKFISEESIKSICKKYGLVYGDAGQYLGDIPEKNLREIEAFKLREEDYFEDISFMFNTFVVNQRSQRMGWGLGNIWDNFGMMIPKTSQELNSSGFNGIIPTILESGTTVNYPPEPKKTKPPFKICAPKEDFNTSGYELKDGYKLIYDPIVIQPVKFKSILGGLIISKWGLEGEDKMLVNEAQN